MSKDPFFGSVLMVPGMSGVSLGGPPNAAPLLPQSDPMTQEWRRWIAENVLLGQPSSSLVEAMVKAGVDRAVAAREIETARTHPYIRAAAARSPSAGAAGVLPARLGKREWILEFQRRLAMLDPTTAAVPVVRRPSRTQFLQTYYAANRPVVIEGAMDNWPALTQWTLEKLKQRFGDRQVEIQAGRNADPDYEINSSNHKRVLNFGQYIDMVRTSGRTNDFYMTGGNAARNCLALAELWDHIVLVPEYLRDQGPEENGLFWFGPAGTVTPLHHDLNNNFMAQVVGRKRVRLIAPHDAAYVYNHRHCYSQVDMDRVDYDKFPLFRSARVFDVTLEPGQMLFVPIGWWHHVTALEVSMTMTFMNFIFENDFDSYYSTYGDV